MHSTEHERWYAELALGEHEVPAHAVAELERCDVCASRAGELDSLRDELEQAGTEQREVLAAARAVSSAPGAAEAERRLRGLIATPRVQHRRQRALALAAVVAVLVGALAFTLGRDPRAPEDPSVLGAGAFTDLAPRGVWPTAVPLTWNYPLPDRGSFVVYLRLRGSPTAFVESRQLASPQWLPAEEARADWPAEFDWQVSAFDASSQLLKSSPRVPVSLR